MTARAARSYTAFCPARVPAHCQPPALRPAADPGERDGEILAELGYDATALGALKTQGVI